MAAAGEGEALTRRGIPLDPQLRVLAIGAFATRFGSGAVMTTSAIYFTRHLGFTVGEVALAVSVAAAGARLAAPPAGPDQGARAATRRPAAAPRPGPPPPA